MSLTPARRSYSTLFSLLLPLLAVQLTGAAFFHDFWIVPSSFKPDAGDVVDVALYVGQPHDGQPYARNPGHIRKFVAVGAQSEILIRGRAGQTPAGAVLLDEPGIVVMGYRSAPTTNELPADQFEAYLEEEGLERVIAARASMGQAPLPGREIFSRCAKAIVQVGGAGSDGFDRTLGFALELLPERSPYDLRAGDTLPVRLLFEGEPLVGALVTAVHPDPDVYPVSIRSDDEGRVRLPLDRAGVWLVKSVHMIPAPGDSGADWESLWATLTFEISG